MAQRLVSSVRLLVTFTVSLALAGCGGGGSSSRAIAVNQAPVAPPISDQSGPYGTVFTFQVPAFSDPDGTQLTYSAASADGSVLPAWLTFDTGSRTFSGTPSERQELDLVVRASDGIATTSATFHLSIFAPPLPLPHIQCSLDEAKSEILQLFEQYYLFNDPTYAGQQNKYPTAAANLANYATVDALLDDLRFQSSLFDRGFTYYSTIEAVNQFFNAGEFVGFGFSVRIDTTGAWRLLDIFAESPADNAEWLRGDTIVSVDGLATAGLTLNDPDTFGDSVEGVTRTFEIDSSGITTTVVLTKRVVDLDPVPADKIRVFSVAGRTVGYLFFRTFISQADAQLRAAFSNFTAQGIDDLILDLRYNGGGLVGTAEVLGSLIVGPGREGQVFFEYRHNPAIAAINDQLRFFQLENGSLPALQNIYYLTDSGTASASELTISGVLPYINTVKIGVRTFGKPVGQWGFNYCNNSMVLFLVTFRTLNSFGDGDYYEGIPVDCAAPDDWDHALGDPAEARLDAALSYIESAGSQCASPPVMGTLSLQSGASIVSPPAYSQGSLGSRFLNAF